MRRLQPSAHVAQKPAGNKNRAYQTKVCGAWVFCRVGRGRLFGRRLAQQNPHRFRKLKRADYRGIFQCRHARSCWRRKVPAARRVVRNAKANSHWFHQKRIRVDLQSENAGGGFKICRRKENRGRDYAYTGYDKTRRLRLFVALEIAWKEFWRGGGLCQRQQRKNERGLFRRIYTYCVEAHFIRRNVGHKVWIKPEFVLPGQRRNCENDIWKSAVRD